MGVNEEPSQLQRLCTQEQIVERTHGDGNRAVSSRWCVAIMSKKMCKRCFPSLQNSGWLKLSHALLLFPLLSQPLYVRELRVRLPRRLRGILLFALHALHLRVCSRGRGRRNISDDLCLGFWQLWICADWVKIVEDRHGLNTQLQTKSYDYSEGHRHYEYTYNKSIQPSFAERNFRS